MSWCREILADAETFLRIASLQRCCDLKRLIGKPLDRGIRLMRVVQQSLFPAVAQPEFPDGFAYCLGVISREDESCLVAEMASLPFKEFQFHRFEGKRRVVSFGLSYDFDQHKALRAEPIPQFLRDVCHQVQDASGFVLPDLQQVLVTEYAPGAPIGWHKIGRYSAP